MILNRLRIGRMLCIGTIIGSFTCSFTVWAWELPADKGVIPEAQVEEILSGKDFPETSGFSKKLEYVDFTANGMQFTQVTMRLDPQKPLLHNGKKIVLVATEEGSSSANGFIE